MRRAKSRSAVLVALSLAGLLGVLYWLTRERPLATPAPQQREPTSAPTDEKVASAPAELQSGLEPAVSPRDSAAAMTKIRLYGLPGRVLLSDATCAIRASRTDVRPLVRKSDASFECPSTDLKGALLEVGASDYVTIGHRLSGDVPPTLDLELQLSGTLDITVVTENEKPVKDALISVYPQDTSKPDRLRIRIPELWKDPLLNGPPSLTNAAGTIQMHGFPCDTPLVVGASRAVADVVERVVIPSTERIARVVLHAPDSGCIRGRLVWPDGSAVTKRFIVRALKPRQLHLPEPQTRSNDQGEFELCGLPRGRVGWCVERIGEHTRLTVVDAEKVDVGLVQLQQLVKLKGRVRLESAPAGFTYGGLNLRLFKDGECVGRVPNTELDGRSSAVNTLERDGMFSAEVPAGALTIYVDGPTGPLCSLDVEVPTSDVEIRLDPYVTSLRVTDVPVRATDRFTLVLKDSTAAHDASGAVIDSPWGAYNHYGPGVPTSVVWEGEDRLWLLLQKPGSYDVFIKRAEASSIFVGSVTLVAGSVATLVCPPQGSGGVTGRVVDHDGSPMAGAPVGASLTIESTETKKSQRVEAREDGSFAFVGLQSGLWTVYPESLGPLSSSAARINVAADSTQDVQLIVEKPGRISGMITFDGVPTPDVKIYLSWARPSGTYSSSFRETKTTASGTYAIESLCPGEYELVMVAPDYVLRRQMIVESGRDSIFNCELNPPVTPIAFVRDGKILDSLDSASQYTRLGAMGLVPWAGRPGVWIGVLDGGPLLALLGSEEIPMLLDPKPPEQYVLAYASACPPVDEYMEIQVRGATLRVRASDPHVVFPWAHVEGVRELQGLWEAGDGPTLVYQDIEGERRFTDVPVGTTLLLVSPRVHSDKTWTQRIVVNNEAEMTIAWPPGQ